MSSSSREDSLTLNGSPRSFAQFERGLENLIEMDLKPGVNIVISKPLVGKIEKMLEWLVSHHITHVNFNQGAPAISPNSVDASFTLPPDRLGQETIRIFRLGQTFDIRTIFLFNLPFCVLPGEDIEALLAARAIKSGCSVRTDTSILFDVNGGLITCNHLPDYPILNKEITKSVLEMETFSEFWESEKMALIRNAACVFRSELCKSCKYWDMCAGGCPIFWSYYDPRQYIRGVM